MSTRPYSFARRLIVVGLKIAERDSEIDAIGRDVLLIADLPVEGEEFVDRPDVAGFVLISRGIFDVVQIKLVVTGGGDSCTVVGPSSLKAVVTIAVCVFLATECLDVARVEALDQRFE